MPGPPSNSGNVSDPPLRRQDRCGCPGSQAVYNKKDTAEAKEIMVPLIKENFSGKGSL
jgi:hypothetical protein